MRPKGVMSYVVYVRLWWCLEMQELVYSMVQNAKETSWDELSSHQAKADSLNLASNYGYIITQF